MALDALFGDIQLSLTIPALLIAIFSTVVISLFLNSTSAGLDHVPGPFPARYTDLWGALTAVKLNRTRSGAAVANFSRALERRYGTTVRTGPNTVTILDPNALQSIYGVRAKLMKSDSYTPFRMGGITTALPAILDEPTHAAYRKLVSNAYTMSALQNYEPQMDRVTDQWLAVFDRFASSGGPVNISQWSHYYCFEVVAVITLGRPLGFLDDKDAFSLIKATTAFSWYIGIASHIPWIHRIFQDNPIMRRASPPPIAKFAEKIVHERLSKPTSSREQSDFLFHFIETHKRQPLMTEEQITISVVGNLLAGTLSPSSAMKELTRYLATHPLSQQKLCEELQHAGVTSPASFASVKDLPYLEGIVREAFRLHAQIIVRQERVAPAGGLTLPDGTYLPAGTKIGALGQAMTLNREVFGDDADEYVPERWTKREKETDEAYTERRNRMERTDMTFGQGSRSCIGKNLTILEFFKAVASLSLCFSFSAVGSMDAFDTYVRVQRRPVGVGKPLIAS